MVSTKKVVLVAAIVVVAAIALIIGLTFALAPIPTFANGGPLGAFNHYIGSAGSGGVGFGTWHGGPGSNMWWQAWHSNNNGYSMNMY
jgi:hypothetical protein